MTAASSSGRRIGATDSKTREQLLDAAERVLMDEGYAAVTSRRVAAAAGLKPQLVHYYFRTMDDLFVEVLRRNAERSLAHAERVLAADPSVAGVWALNNDPRGARFLVEFAALANHRKEVRAELARYAKRNRAMQLKVLKRVLASEAGGVPPMVALLVMTGLGQVMGIEQALGVTEGHAAARSFVESRLQ